MQIQLQVILSTSDVEKATLAFAFALAAASSGTNVAIFFTMSGACWTDALNGNDSPITGFESISHYWELMKDMSVQFEGCTSCVENYCHVHKGAVLRSNLVMAGLSAAAIRSANTPTVVF